MLDILTYKWIHLVGLFLVWTALGGAVFHGLNGGTRDTNTRRKLIGITHGIGMFVLLLGGFGALAKMGMTQGLPGWVMAKLVVWLLIGAMLPLANRFPKAGMAFFLALPAVGAIGAWLAIWKPF